MTVIKILEYCMQTNFNKIEDGTCQGWVRIHLAMCDLFISVNGIYIYSITAFNIRCMR